MPTFLYWFASLPITCWLVINQALFAQTPSTPVQKNRVDSHGDPLPPKAVRRFGGLRFRDGKFITALAWTPDGKTIATTSLDDTIKFWDRATGKVRRQLPLPLVFRGSNFVQRLTFSPDGRFLAASSTWNNTVVMDLTTGKPTIQCKSHFVVFSRDSKTLFANGKPDHQHVQGGDVPFALGRSPVLCWDVATGKEKTSVGQGVPLAISPDGRYLATVAGKTTISWGGAFSGLVNIHEQILAIWDIKTGRQIRRLPVRDYAVTAGVFTPKGFCFRLLAPRFYQETESHWLWPSTGKLIRMGNDKGVMFEKFVFSPDGKRLALLGYNAVTIWDLASNKRLRQFAGPRWPHEHQVAFSPDGKHLALHRNNVMLLWDVETGKELAFGDGHRMGVVSVDVSPDGKTLVSIDEGEQILLWDRQTGALRKRIAIREDTYCPSVRFSPDGKHFATVGQGDIVVRNLAGRTLYRLANRERYAIKRVAFSPDGKIVAASSDNGRVVAFATATGKKLWALHKLSALDLTFSPDGRYLVVTGPPYGLMLLHPATGKRLPLIPTEDIPAGKHHYLMRVAFSRSGRMLAYCHLQNIHLYEMAAHRRRLTVENFSTVSAMALSPDGKQLAVAVEDGLIRLYDTFTGEEKHELTTDHRGKIHELTFTPDGQYLISAGQDTTVVLWKLPGFSRRVTRPSRERNLALWKQLAAGDAPKAYQAQRQLAEAINATSFLGEQIRSLQKTAAKDITRWIRDLDSNRFRTRQRAQQNLIRHAIFTEGRLRQTLKKPISLEVHQRIQLVLRSIAQPKGGHLRWLRVVEILEWLDTPDARRTVAEMRRLIPAGTFAEHLQETLARMKKHAP